MIRYLRWSIIPVLAVALTSCQDPAYKARQSAREDRIDRYLGMYMSREQAGPENIEALTELDREMEKIYAERLAETIKKINERYKYDNERWIELRSIREEHLRKLLEGKPEDIPEVWGKMIY